MKDNVLSHHEEIATQLQTLMGVPVPRRQRSSLTSAIGTGVSADHNANLFAASTSAITFK